MNISEIVCNHYKIFKNDIYQLITFILIPFLLSISVVMDGNYLTSDRLNDINIILSIFMAMFFCLLGLTTSSSANNTEKENEKESEKKLRKELSKQLFDTLLFQCYIGIILFSMSFFYQIVYGQNELTILFNILYNYLLISLFMNSFIVIKRIEKLNCSW